MKRSAQLLLFALFVNTTVLCAQKITSFKADPSVSVITPNEKGKETSNGERPVKVNLLLSGKTKRDIYYRLAIIPDTLHSKPVLLNPVIRITPGDFKAGKFNTVLNIKLKELECLTDAEKFSIGYMRVDKTGKGKSEEISIIQIVPPKSSTVELMEGSKIIAPYLKSDKDGYRTAELSLVLKGDGKDLAKDIIIQCQLPPFVKSASDPKLRNDFDITVKRSLFNKDGCPKVIRMTVELLLSKIDELKKEETIPVIISKDGVPDYAHAYNLILKTPEIKTPEKTAEVPKTESKKGHSFSHSCVSGKNFIITLLPDSTVGGKVEIKEEKDTVVYSYAYYQFFHTADFAKWLLNIFTTRINRFPCNDCVTCVSYMAERAYEELNALKKIPTPVLPAVKTETEKEKTAEPAKGADSAKTVKAALPDTFVYHMSYADTSIFNLSVTKEKDITSLELCKDPKAGDGDCIKERVVDADEKSLNNRVLAMLQKLTGEKVIDTPKVKPANVYGKYKKDEAAKQVKEKPAEIKLIEDRITALENEKVTNTDVGTVSLRDTTGKIKIHKPDGSVFETEIDTVFVVIRDGQLMRKQLLVKTADKYFWNHEAPIPVNRINERGGDKLGRKNMPNQDYILLGDILEYIGDGYISDDTDIVLTPAKSQKRLSTTSNLNSLINFAIYTDLTGLLGRRANGIINTDISGRFITNTRNIPNMDLTPLAFLEGNFVLSKFDSKFKSLDSSSIKVGKGGEKDTIDRMQMMQTAWFKGSVKLNLMSWRFFYYQGLFVNIGSRINVVNADSLFRKERDVVFFDYYLEAVYSINKLKNFGMDLSLRWLKQRVADKEPFSNSEWESVFNPQIAFSYYPTDNRNSRIYLRFNYFANRKKDANNFYQLQFGIKSDLKFGSKK